MLLSNGFKQAQLIKHHLVNGKSALDEISGLLDSAHEQYGQFEGSMQFKKRNRTLELVILNGTQHVLEFGGEHFDSGAFFVHPKPMNIQPGQAGVLYVFNRQAAIMCGVTGSLDYGIKGAQGNLHLYIGFNHPYIGSYKTFVGVGYMFNPRYGYEMSKDDSYKNKMEMGYRLTAAIREPRQSPHKMFEYTITHL